MWCHVGGPGPEMYTDARERVVMAKRLRMVPINVSWGRVGRGAG